MSNYAKLKTNLKLAIQRCKLLEKKKTELSLKSRKEIADYLAINKVDRARIRVEHIIREDNYVEAMEMLEMFCDMLLARFGLIEKMKELDPGLDESIATIIWSSPRVSSDILEFKTIADILTAKYGKKYAEACKADSINNVNEKVKKRLGLEAPPKLLVEQYLIEIAKNFNVAYVPDNNIMLSSGMMNEELISLRDTVNEITKNNNNNNSGSSGGNGGGGSGGPGPEPLYAPQGATAYPVDAKQVPLGFDDNQTENLIDFEEKDLNNNITTTAKSGVSRLPNYPPLPGALPVGDASRPVSTATGSRNSPPPNYKKSIPNEDNTQDSYSAPPLPMKNNDFYNQPAQPSDNKSAGQPPADDFYAGMNQFQPPPPSYQSNVPSNQNFPSANLQPRAPPADDEDELVLPSVPGDNNNETPAPDPNASIEFDDLAKRFENLKNFK